MKQTCAGEQKEWDIQSQTRSEEMLPVACWRCHRREVQIQTLADTIEKKLSFAGVTKVEQIG